MATKKTAGGTKKTSGVDFGSRFLPSVGRDGDVANNEKHESVPWTLLITLLAVLLTFFIVMPVLGFMYIDLVHIREALVIEVRKTKELRRQIIQEIRNQE